MLFFFSKKWKQTENWFRSRIRTTHGSLFRKKNLENPICKILCVDDDHSFCLFMQKLADSLNIQLDTVYTIQEAKEAIEKNLNHYQAFIIDGHLPDGSGFELVAWIREEKFLKVPIGFISRIYRDAASFRVLKGRLQVNYVLEKPMSPAEIRQLLIDFCHLASPQHVVGNEPLPDAVLEDLKVRYQKTISDKVESLEKIILIVQKNPSLENLQVFKDEVHKIAGSAGTYGFTAVSDLCKKLEIDLIKQIDLVKKDQFNHRWLVLLDDFFAEIKLNFQMRNPDHRD